MGPKPSRIIILVLIAVLVVWGIVYFIRLSSPTELSKLLDVPEGQGNVEISHRIDTEVYALVLSERADRDAFLERLLALGVRMYHDQKSPEQIDWTVSLVLRPEEEAQPDGEEEQEATAFFGFTVSGELMYINGIYYAPLEEGAFEALLESTWSEYADKLEFVGDIGQEAEVSPSPAA